MSHKGGKIRRKQNHREDTLPVKDICDSFPNVELCYETIIHKKVYDADFCLLVPEGTKTFIWFTTLRNQNVCLSMTIGEKKQIQNVRIAHAAFNSKLSYGTILYGTTFRHNKSFVFSIEDIMYYKGKSCSQMPFNNKLVLFRNLLSKDISSYIYTQKQLLFGVPLIGTQFDELIKNVPSLPYPVDSIQFRKMNKNKGNHCFTMKYYKQNMKMGVIHHGKNSISVYNEPRTFLLRAAIQTDVYHLCVYNDNRTDEIWGTASIPDYKTSVMMNKLFRVIKENDNLDALEESDDEEEFEDDREDKYVYLDKKIPMVCEYHRRFKKWVPIRLAKKEERVISKRDIERLEKQM